MHRRPQRRQRTIKFADRRFVGQIDWRFDMHAVMRRSPGPTLCGHMADRAGVDQYLNDRRAQGAGAAGYDNMVTGEIEVEHVAISFFMCLDNIPISKYARPETKSKPVQLLAIIRMLTGMAHDHPPPTFYSTQRWIEHF